MPRTHNTVEDFHNTIQNSVTNIHPRFLETDASLNEGTNFSKKGKAQCQVKRNDHAKKKKISI